MLSSYSHLKNILNSAKNLLSNSIILSCSELKKISCEGNSYNLYKCDGCKNIFNAYSEEIIYVFACGHKYHEECAEYHGELLCPICMKNEIEENVTNPSTRRLSLSGKESKSEIKMDLKRQQNMAIENKSKLDNRFDRLRAFDKHYLQKDLFLYD